LALIALAHSPLAPGRSPVRTRVRESGADVDRSIVFLHSGWGYEIYPFDRVAPAFASTTRIVIPDRSGYGGSDPIETLPVDFHRRAAVETVAVIDTLALTSPVLWGHSDGAIIALLVALASPARVAGVIVEATHLWKRKPASRAFFQAAIADPDGLGPGVTAILERDHGPRWREVIRLHARAWLRIGDEAASDSEDFYDRRLADVAVPVLVVHGARDPRTEPGELDALTAALGGRAVARTAVIVLPDGGHSPHSERLTTAAVATAGADFCAAIAAQSPAKLRQR
jgi:pimeloyl-ACP methyl ester carboxylesterase